MKPISPACLTIANRIRRSARSFDGPANLHLPQRCYEQLCAHRSKDDPRLPRPAAPDRWHFWMQIGPLQPEHREYGFNVWAAVKEIATNGYHLFTGSQTLLRKRPLARSQPAAREGQTDA